MAYLPLTAGSSNAPMYTLALIPATNKAETTNAANVNPYGMSLRMCPR
jgi:hypothetical protein